MAALALGGCAQLKQAVQYKGEGTYGDSWEQPSKEPIAVQKFDFRGASWGESKVVVAAREKEKNPITRKTGAVEELRFMDSLFGEPVVVSYEFVNGALYRAGYDFSRLRSCSSAIPVFQKVENELSIKYGEPSEQKNYPTRTERCGMTRDWQLVSNGKNTKIQTLVQGNPYQSKVLVLYTDTAVAATVPAANAVLDKGKL